MRLTRPGEGVYRLGAGESIRTEISCKYDAATLGAICAAARLEVERWREHERHGYALILLRPA
jgi:uncharacterized SAM-dependent methyltransferase